MCPTPDDEGVNGLTNGGHVNGHTDGHTNGHANGDVTACRSHAFTLYTVCMYLRFIAHPGFTGIEAAQNPPSNYIRNPYQPVYVHRVM